MMLKLTKCFGAMAVAVCLGLVGCDESPAPTNAQNSTPTASATNGGLAMSAITLGKTKATEQFIAKKWQVVSLGKEPVKENLVLDLTNFRDGRGEFSDGCERILLELNTYDVSNERLLIDHSTRQSDGCNSELIDDVMWMLSDVYGFERSGDELRIITVQDTMRLIPAK